MPLYVARGRSVATATGVATQGEQVTLDHDDADRLIALGYVQSSPPCIEPAPAANPSGIGLQVGQGAIGANHVGLVPSGSVRR